MDSAVAGSRSEQSEARRRGASNAEKGGVEKQATSRSGASVQKTQTGADEICKVLTTTEKGATPTQTTFNIVKNIVGGGMLSLPAGIAAGTGLIVGIVIALAFGLLMGYTFAVMGRVCAVTNAKTHKDCASAVTGGTGLAQTMAVTLLVKTLFTCVSYAMIIGDSYSSILHSFGFTGFFTSKQVVLIVIVAGILVPLCLQRDLSFLSYTSLLGIACQVFVAVFMTVRLVDGSYTPQGQFYEHIPASHQVDFGTPDSPHMWDVSITTLILVASLSTAFIAHYNAPKFYNGLEGRNPTTFSQVVGVAFVVSFGIYAWVMAVGYLTFGKNSNGLILNNYAEVDPGATAARVAIGVSVLFSFPLSFTGLRDATMSTFALDPDEPKNFVGVTFSLIGVITVVGCLLNDLGLVNSLGGAVFGALITLIFPGLLFFFMAQKVGRGELTYTSGGLAAEKAVSMLMIGLGLLLLVFGSAVVLLKKFYPAALGLA